jgi:hypothetical protein
MKTLSPTSPYGYTIFCDDLRREVNGKAIYIGVYAGAIVVPFVPIGLTSLVAMVTYRERPGESTDPVVIKIFIPNNTEDNPSVTVDLAMDEHRKAQRDASPGLEDGDRFISVEIPIMVSPFLISSEGFVRVRAYRGDEEIKLGSLRVQVGQVVGSPFQPPPPPSS